MKPDSNLFQKDERYNGRMGFGGSTPCAQTRGKEIFIDKHPEEYLRQGDFQPKPAFFGANKHEGSFVLGGNSLCSFTINMFNTITRNCSSC